LGDSEIDLEVSAAPLITGDASSDWIVALDLAPEKVPEPEPPSLWKGVSEAAPIGLVVLRSDGIIRSLNPAAAHLLHQNAESPVGSTWVSMANESNLSAWDASLEKWRSGQFGSIRLPFTLGDSEIDLEVSAAPLITGDASSDWIVALDLAPEKVPEPEPPSLWKGVSEAAPIGLVVLRSDGIIRSLNPAAAQLLHRSEEASVGSTWVSMASEPGLAAWNDSLEKWRKGQFDSVHLPFLANGTDLELEAAAAPFVASDASSDWIVALQPAPAKPPESNSLDSFLRLERSQREILLATGPSVSRLLEDIADIRRNTVGLREKAGWAINPDGLNHINQLEESAQDAAQRLEGWFDYQMAMTRELHYTAVDLSLIAKETADIRKADFDRVGAVLTVRDLPMIEADPDLLHMMFRNLYDFTLSQKLAGTHPQVLVRATIVRAPEKSASPGWCQLSLEFDSPVTTEEELEHLFQVAAKPSEKVPGGSLGLLTVRRIAERHGGTVSAQPREGGGVSLIVVLPLLAPKAS
jgi:PAS domain-containing protein